MSIAIVIALLLVIIAAVAIIALFGCILEAMGEGIESVLDPIWTKIEQWRDDCPWPKRILRWGIFLIGSYIAGVVIILAIGAIIGVPCYLIFG